jgi:hypothetical protein
VPITSKSSKFKGETKPCLVKLPKSAGARHYCPKFSGCLAPLAPELTQAMGLVDSKRRASDKDLPVINLVKKWHQPLLHGMRNKTSIDQFSGPCLAGLT